MNHMWSRGVKDLFWSMMHAMSTPTQFKLRVSPELKAKIDAASEASRSSISSEINERLEKSFVLPEQIAALQSDVRILKMALEAAYTAMENQNKLITLLTVRPSPELETPEYIAMHRELVAGDAWDKLRADMKSVMKSLKEVQKLVP